MKNYVFHISFEWPHEVTVNIDMHLKFDTFKPCGKQQTWKNDIFDPYPLHSGQTSKQWNGNDFND